MLSLLMIISIAMGVTKQMRLLRELWGGQKGLLNVCYTAGESSLHCCLAVITAHELKEFSSDQLGLAGYQVMRGHCRNADQRNASL